jgi:hypothetical protein
MKLGDDIHSLLHNILHDTNIYQDLKQYNAIKLARMKKAQETPATTSIVPVQARTANPALNHAPNPTGLTEILRRLADPATASPSPAPEPTRLEHLFGRLSPGTSPTPRH